MWSRTLKPCRGDHFSSYAVVRGGLGSSEVPALPRDADAHPTVSGIAPGTSLIIRCPAQAGPPALGTSPSRPRLPDE
ncbi:hypothetical protein GCM10010350_66730 [Streptomyces galilaeus]|nr:hypothetical protein GCM10010350_66730 [Streptomyces galilaeus]